MIKGVVVDASTIGGNPGLTEVRGIDLRTGEIIFQEKIGIASNNIGEFLAICYAIEHIGVNKLPLPVYSDSKIAISWAERGECRTNIFLHYPNLNTNGLAEKITEGEQILKTYKCEIKFWDNRLKENPADFGRK